MTSTRDTNDKSSPVKTIAVLGCGDLGQRLADQLPTDQYRVVGIRRRPCQHPRIDYRQADCRDLESLDQALPLDCDAIILTLTPSERSDRGYEQAYVETVDNLLALLEQRLQDSPNQPPPSRVLFVSSSSVYAQDNGETVNEHSQTTPSHFSGCRLLEAERQLQANTLPSSSCQTIVVRFSGIYGPGRHRLIQQVINGQGAPTGDPIFSNRIHADDCAGVLAHLLQIDAPDSLYLASDCEPSSLGEVTQWLAQQMGLPANHLQPGACTNRASKRCDNQRLLDSGYRFRYPSFRQGYAEVLKQWQQESQQKDNRHG